jgi:hypothetical protein
MNIMRNSPFLFVFVLFLVGFEAFGQEKCPKSAFKTEIILTNTPTISEKVVLESVSETAISVLFCQKNMVQNRRNVPFSELLFLKSHRKTNWKVGCVIGFGVGLMIGVASANRVAEPSCNPTAFLCGLDEDLKRGKRIFIGTFSGMIVGGLASKVVNFEILFNGKKSNATARQLAKLRQISTDPND